MTRTTTRKRAPIDHETTYRRSLEEAATWVRQAQIAAGKLEYTLSEEHLAKMGRILAQLHKLHKPKSKGAKSKA